VDSRRYQESNDIIVINGNKENKMSKPDERYITTKEAARRAGVGILAIHRWMKRGFFGYKNKNLKERVINEREFTEFLTEFTAPIRHDTA
jgi:hypothetical protein